MSNNSSFDGERVMADNGIHGVVVDMQDTNSTAKIEKETDAPFSRPFFQKLKFVDKNNQNRVTLPGIATVWGLLVMVLVYTLRHISDAHFNPAVTIANAVSGRFPLKQVPAYVLAQLIGSTLAAGTLRLLFTGIHDQFAGTQPSGSNVQACVVEFIITFYLSFVRFGVATDDRAVSSLHALIGELAGLAVGATIVRTGIEI